MNDMSDYELVRSEEKEPKFTRREFLNTLGIAAGAGIAADALNRFGAFHALYNAGKNIAEFTVSGARIASFFQTLKSHQEILQHEGKLRFLVPEHIGEYAARYTEEERKLIEHVIGDATVTLDNTFGGPQSWTEGETSIVIPDIINIQDKDSIATFIDGDALIRPGRLHNAVARHINLLIIPKHIASDFVEASNNGDRSSIVYPIYIIHEMTHAYNQSDLPAVVKEGLSKMSEFIYLRKLEPKVAPLYEQLISGIATSVNTMEIAQKQFSKYVDVSPEQGENMYSTVGYLFLNWYDDHPDFFKQVRQKENEFFTNNTKKPSFNEWVVMGEQVDVEFRSWLQAQPVFSMKD